ncbi:adenosine deaminase, partial [Kibdelosporangium lantanae]
DAMRGQPAGLVLASSWARSGEHARQIAELSNRYDTVGFGLSNDERRGRVDDFVAAARTTTRMVVPHGGFYEGAWHVRECVGKLNARRIGHGLKAMHDNETIDLLVEKEVALEVCPTSYPPLGVAEYEDLPLRTLLARGVRVTLANDDPLLFGATVTDQYVIARDTIGLTDEELTAIAEHSLKASSMP